MSDPCSNISLFFSSFLYRSTYKQNHYRISNYLSHSRFFKLIQDLTGTDWPPYADIGSDKEEILNLTLDEVGKPSLASIEPLSSPTKLIPNDYLDSPSHSKHRTDKVERDREGAEGRNRDGR